MRIDRLRFTLCFIIVLCLNVFTQNASGDQYTYLFKTSWVSNAHGKTTIDKNLTGRLSFAVKNRIKKEYQTDLPRIQACSISVNYNKVENKISSLIYGSNIEDVNHEIYGGFYDQRIFGESFEEPATGVNFNEWRRY